MENNIQTLIDLAKEHPDLPIVAVVDGEIVGGDNYCRWLGGFGNVELCEKFGYGPGINEYTLQNGYCTRKRYEENKENEKRLEAYLDEVAERAFKAAIIVNIDFPDDVEEFGEKERTHESIT